MWRKFIILEAGMQNSILRLFLLYVICAACVVLPVRSEGAVLDGISNAEAAAGLKEALARGAQAAVQQLGAENGFFGNERVRIPMPEGLQKAEGLMRRFGMSRQADELVLRMNRAAEAAVPEARVLLVSAIKQMSVKDARAVLTGGDDAATQYFRRTTSEALGQRFLPIVKRATARVKLAEQYNTFAETGVRLGLVNREDANLEVYVTRKALDGLFLVIAEEEKKIRADPLRAASAVIRRVFGPLAAPMP
jgi:hypothetical protein